MSQRQSGAEHTEKMMKSLHMGAPDVTILCPQYSTDLSYIT